MKRKFLLVGLTGGIASGKSIVAQRFVGLGAHLIDADKISREIAIPDEPAWCEIVKEFGEEVLLPDRSLNRKKIAELIFSNPENRNILNQIMHDRIIEREDKIINTLIEQDYGGVVIVDAALMIETGSYKRMDKLIVVYANEECQLKRIIQRDGVTVEEARNRIASQMPMDEKKKLADYVIDNSGDIDSTFAQVDKLYSQLLVILSGSRRL